MFIKVNFVNDFIQVIMFVNIINEVGFKFKVMFMGFKVEVELIIGFPFLVVSQMHFRIKDE